MAEIWTENFDMVEIETDNFETNYGNMVQVAIIMVNGWQCQTSFKTQEKITNIK